MLHSYTETAAKLMKFGAESQPRGIKTFEVIGAQATFTPTLYINRHKGSHALAELEALMLIAGVFDIDLIKRIAPNANHDLFLKQSDYGPRTKEGLIRAQQTLIDDSDSRRAVVFLNDRNQPLNDLACTTSLQFLIRQDILYTIVTMRSWDVVYGLPADIIMFGYVSSLMAATLGVGVGDISVNAGSFHLYGDKAELARESSDPQRKRLTYPSDYEGHGWDEIALFAEDELANYVNDRTFPFETLSETVKSQQFQLR